MSFINDCCRTHFIPADTGEEFTCDCGNHFIYDGDRWQNVLGIGSRKTEKYRRIRMTNNHIRKLAEDQGLNF